ncbi:MAG: aspartate aminotransferase family protein, partial [Actinomycetota bacterium]
RMYRLLERAQRGLFAQLVVVPLFKDHRVLTQVAGHDMAVVKALPPLMLSDEDLTWFVDALHATIEKARRMPTSLTKFALSAAGIGR